MKKIFCDTPGCGVEIRRGGRRVYLDKVLLDPNMRRPRRLGRSDDDEADLCAKHARAVRRLMGKK